MMPVRRDLSFARLDEVMPEVERLLHGYVATGQWSLGQVCRHLSVALRGSAASRPREGDPTEPTAEQIVARHQTLELGQIRPGVPIPLEALKPSPGLDDRDEAERLRATLAAFVAAPGPFGPHPLLGPFTRDDWLRFHCVHGAHHLSFLVPAPDAAGRPAT